MINLLTFSWLTRGTKNSIKTVLPTEIPEIICSRQRALNFNSICKLHLKGNSSDPKFACCDRKFLGPFDSNNHFWYSCSLSSSAFSFLCPSLRGLYSGTDFATSSSSVSCAPIMLWDSIFGSNIFSWSDCCCLKILTNSCHFSKSRELWP